MCTNIFNKQTPKGGKYEQKICTNIFDTQTHMGGKYEQTFALTFLAFYVRYIKTCTEKWGKTGLDCAKQLFIQVISNDVESGEIFYTSKTLCYV